MLILAFDTTSEFGGAGIFRDTECLARLDNEGTANSYSVALFEMVDRLLARASGSAKLTLRDIDLFAAANGPGSFTGIRVGLAAAQAWAAAFERPARGVSVFEAMLDEGNSPDAWAAAILDARRSEFYLGLYRREEQGGAPRFVAEGEGRVLKPGAVKAFLAEKLPPGAAASLVVREGDRAARELAHSLLQPAPCRQISGTLVAAIARLAFRAQKGGTPPTPAELDACYIRRTDAELSWKE